MRYAVSRRKPTHYWYGMGHQYGRGLMISGPSNHQLSKRFRYDDRLNEGTHSDWFLYSPRFRHVTMISNAGATVGSYNL